MDMKMKRLSTWCTHVVIYRNKVMSCCWMLSFSRVAGLLYVTQMSLLRVRMITSYVGRRIKTVFTLINANRVCAYVIETGVMENF